MIEQSPDGPAAGRRRSKEEYIGEIVDAATELFAREGYAGTSMRDIGRVQGVHAGSLYTHIEGKEDLLFQIVLRIMRRSETDMAEVLSGAGTATEQLYAIAERQLRLLSENLPGATVFFHEWRSLSPERQRQVIAFRDAWESGLRDVIERGVRDGEFAPIDAKTAGLAIIGMLNWAYVWYRPGGERSVEELARAFVDIVVNGLAVR